MSHDPRPIGVFDSGVGGLTVLRALLHALPAESVIYLGDTARLPYGTKSPETVVRYALRAAESLESAGIKALVIACNTASAAALPALRERFPDLPVIGVIEPGAAAACAATRNGHVAVLATEGTVAGGAYQRAIEALRPGTRVTAIASQVFVALAEEGWTTGEVVTAAARRYLEPLLGQGPSGPDTLLLGCTHFPVLAGALSQVVGGQLQVVDASAAVAAAVQARLQQAGALADPARAVRSLQLRATDGIARFARVGTIFLGRPLAAQEVQLVDL